MNDSQGSGGAGEPSGSLPSSGNRMIVAEEEIAPAALDLNPDTTKAESFALRRTIVEDADGTEILLPPEVLQEALLKSSEVESPVEAG